MRVLGDRWAPRVPAHQLTTRHLGAAYPLLVDTGSLERGVLVGRNLLGGAFAHDPFELYRHGLVSNPNMVVFGQIGRGKSAFVKSYLWRQAVFGRRAWVVDPKGEYRALAERWGVRPVALRPGGNVRLNPLDAGEDGRVALGHAGVFGRPALGGVAHRTADGAAERTADGMARGAGTARGEAGGGVEVPGPAPLADRRRSELLATLAAAALGRDLRPRERTALELALATVDVSRSVPTLPAVVERMLEPIPGVAEHVRTDHRSLVEDGRDVALELRRLVHGDLRGMFDGPTTGGIDLSAPLVVLDLSALYNSPALAILMACATAWLHAALETQRSSERDRTFVVVDEAWAILAQLAVARWLQASWKLSRARGVANVAVLHRVSDLRAVGAQGSEQVGLAHGLLADSETRVVYAQPPGEIHGAADLLSLSATESELLPQLRRGVALWKVGARSFLVQHVLAPGEHAIIDTDTAMLPAGVRR